MYCRALGIPSNYLKDILRPYAPTGAERLDDDDDDGDDSPDHFGMTMLIYSVMSPFLKQNYIVNCQKEVEPPSYLNDRFQEPVTFDLTPIMKETRWDTI